MPYPAAAARGRVVAGVGAPVVPWYLSGGVPAANCLAAYQPKGAANLAASYVNLITPGTYDCTTASAPTWGAVNGWSFNDIDNYLDTGIVPGSGYTAILRFSDLGIEAETLFGISDVDFFYIYSDLVGYDDSYIAYGDAEIGGVTLAASGVVALAGGIGYLNGVLLVDTAGVWAGGNTYSFYIGANNGLTVAYGLVKIQAVSIYDIALTAPQVLAISTAMAAL